MTELNSSSIKGLLENLNARVLPAEAKEKLIISKLVYDSRKVVQGSAFFCIPGVRTDGNEFVAQAVKSGAICIVSEKEQENLSIPQIIVDDVRLALAQFSDAFYSHPSRKVRMIGVTGTNGKTTSTHLIEKILNESGQQVGLIGTLGTRTPGSNMQEAVHTTPQAPELQEMISSMAAENCNYITMEVSSHGLFLKRVAGCQFAVAVLTNITQDHLDFHKTMDNYWRAKRILFESLNTSKQSNKAAVVNLDDALASEFLAACGPDVKQITYGFAKKADVHVISSEWKDGRSQLKLKTPAGEMSLSMRIAGRFNIYNAMAAIAVCLHEGISKEQIIKSLEDFKGVPGRFETVSIGLANEPLCIVDYAHTPDGLENVLRTAADLKKEGSKLICVFGCGGDRDPSKRPQMGEIAETLADYVIVSSDNPRTENPQEIIANILAGIKRMKNIDVEPDRAKAIRLAVSQAGPNDIVMIAGKGHENYQLVMDQVLPFDDKIEVSKALEERFGSKARH